ncbi:MAG TPA: PQQ-dependent sugar dehydrogenase, partial [Flavobacterium sp.]|nr:PQQ-dependent sugar dehydrogenase [Flavobacterium sp.]
MKKIILVAFIIIVHMSSAQTVGIELFAQGLVQPCEITHAGDDRLFVVEKGGTIKIVNVDGSVNSTPFLTIPASQLSFGFERGLLGLAFHPQFATNGYFFTCYTKSGDGAVVISRYSVSNNPNIADPTSRIDILTIPHPVTDVHNGGTLRFGPDGYLYIGIGDGGWPPQNASNITSNLGKMLRIDVDNPSNGMPYSCPETNPYRFSLGNDEIWAMGFRN